MGLTRPYQVKYSDGQFGVAELVDCVNVTRTPAVRDKIISGIFHRIPSSDGKGYITVEKTFFYADFGRNQFFLVRPRSERHTWKDASAQLERMIEKVPGFISDKRKRHVRAVFGLGELREKIVADGINDSSFSMENKGRYVNAEQMNELLQQDGTVVIDMRNHYEYEVGHFENAIEIPSDTFREQLPMAVDMMKDSKDKNIIMYCTGGIRCEKASAYMLHRGFKNVFHLEGGIIHYANKVKQQQLPNKFHGKNFVFDDRLGERISDEIIAHCHQCGAPADTHTNCRNQGCHLLFIQCEQCADTYQGCCSAECREVILLPEEEQKEMRKGISKGHQVFNKSRQRKISS